MTPDETGQQGEEGRLPLPEPLPPHARARGARDKSGRTLVARNVLNYQKSKAVDRALAPLLAPVAGQPGYVEYVLPIADDAGAAARLTAELGFEITAANVAAIRASEYGRLPRKVPVESSDRDALGRLVVSVAALEAAVAELRGALGETRPLYERVNHLEERLGALIELVEKSVVPDPDGTIGRLRQKYRVTRK